MNRFGSGRKCTYAWTGGDEALHNAGRAVQRYQTVREWRWKHGRLVCTAEQWWEVAYRWQAGFLSAYQREDCRREGPKSSNFGCLVIVGSHSPTCALLGSVYYHAHCFLPPDNCARKAARTKTFPTLPSHSTTPSS